MVANRATWWQGVDRFFCISAAQRHLLVAAGMPADRLVVKHNFVPAPPAVRRGAGDHLLYLGRLSRAKGIRLLMAAWDELTCHQKNDVPLVIAGSGDLEQEVTAWAAGRADVQFLGLRSRSQCAELTAHARAAVMPSEWAETFGLVAVEAMAAGVPTVAAAHGAFMELITDGDSGLLHEPGDVASLCAGLRAVTDPDTSVRLGAAARRRYLADFTEEVALRRQLDAYRNVLARRPEVSV
jgi:glycosyltransferase involved in cell wall biosynthesis